MQNRDFVERQYAEFYNLYVSDFRQDIPVFLDLAGKHPGPVLEVGCATGRVTARLAAAGHEVVGIDTSRPMLELARRKLEPFGGNARIADFDLRQGALHERFHTIIASLHTFNALIDVEEQRLFLRHLARTFRSPGVVVLDLFCPLSMVHPETAGQWRVIERSVAGRHLHVRDRREMLTPLLERRTQVFRIDEQPEVEAVTHRRYLAPQLAGQLLTEAGFESVRWIQGYDLSAVSAIDASARPTGPFLVLAEG